jgi:4-amino-4-deoxy-L-arabinose transferase-like glycosyltransferase
VALGQEKIVSKRVERALLAVILAIFVLLGLTYSVVAPPFEASDELWHYPLVETIADNWELPVQDPANVGPWRQEGSQPPLYYFLGALATFWIDTSDMERVRHLNTQADNGVATPDGNINLVVHDPARESFPWHGTALAVHLVRLLSVGMAAVGVYLTYLVVCAVFPGWPALALGAAAVHAFTPMVVFISGAVNNDNLVVPLSSLALLMILEMAKEQSSMVNSRRSVIRTYLSLGLALGLAALTKTSSLALTVLAALVVVVRAVRRRSWREFFLGGVLTLLPFLAVAGWWYLRNLRLYGDLSGLNTFTEILGARGVPADLAQLWRERYSFMAGYWGNFGGLNVPMPGWAYSALNILVVVAALGLVVTLVKSLARTPGSREERPAVWGWGFAICLLWALGVLVPWALWARVTWSSQGRLIFAALPVWSLLLVLGLAGWLPRRWGRWVAAAFILFLLGLAAAAPFVWVAPAYALPEPLTDAQVAASAHPMEVEFDGVMRLLGYDLETGVVEPGGQVEVTLAWEVLGATERDAVVFVHLLGEQDLLVAQRDTFPGLGRLSTTRLESGFRWADRVVLQVPATAYTPDVAQVEVGLYDGATGARLAAVGPGGEDLGDNVRFGRVEVRARPGDVPNPIYVNFGDRMALVGYDLSGRAVRPGETVTLTLYWRGLRRMSINYTVSAQLVDEGQRKAAQHDGWPLEGTAPTAAWEPGEFLTEARLLEVFPDAPPGVYDVRVTVYVLEEGQIVRLPVVPAGGEMLSDHVVLTRVRVGP